MPRCSPWRKRLGNQPTMNRKCTRRQSAAVLGAAVRPRSGGQGGAAGQRPRKRRRRVPILSISRQRQHLWQRLMATGSIGHVGIGLYHDSRRSCDCWS
ncbi:unnamed protein product [Symbiodinium necroappetens]|uniref:Uncharacterized protein n=1 Tax=Symbiodinium necroappetens TaxID=1628268 RepID=A0A812WCU9_9DINO|nr:unnamed protein product [Symbiodinium necroappetens]